MIGKTLTKLKLKQYHGLSGLMKPYYYIQCNVHIISIHAASLAAKCSYSKQQLGCFLSSRLCRAQMSVGEHKKDVFQLFVRVL